MSEPDDNAISAMIHLRADMLRLAGMVDSMVDLASITQVRFYAPKIAERMRVAVSKPEYVAASTRHLAVKVKVKAKP